MNKRVKGAIGEDAAAVRKAAGRESTKSRLHRLAHVVRHEPVVVVLLLIAAFTTISGEPGPRRADRLGCGSPGLG